MNILETLRERFAEALRVVAPGQVEDLAKYLSMIQRSQDAKFGDYQANCAMPLAKLLGKLPRDVAGELLKVARLDDLCETPEIAGPGFINLLLRDAVLAARANAAISDPRVGAPPATRQATYVVDFSAPNVAKPMHVGHIRSTVLGDCLYRVLQFLGHRVIGDNHIGDWGTQFGMIIYGYRNFLDREAYAKQPVAELARIYRLVNQLVDYYESVAALPKSEQEVAAAERRVSELSRRTEPDDPKIKKEVAKELRSAKESFAAATEKLAGYSAKVEAVIGDTQLAALAAKHAGIGAAVLEETAKLHAGDAENRRLWEEILPPCRDEIDEMYRRLGVKFDVTLGESFYHDRLAAVVESLAQHGIARESDGARCVFFEGSETPMIVQKRDGAFLYATSDLATIQYRMETWRPDVILYVVGTPQSLHFEQLFAAARRWGNATGEWRDDIKLVHVAFGSVLGEDGKIFRTRAGGTVGLANLLDGAEAKALEIVSASDDAKPNGAELSAEERQRVAEVVGVGAIKYADLSHNRTSDYVFSYDKMMATTGNTATYLQYAYARVQNIFARGEVNIDALRKSGAKIAFTSPAERALALEVLRFGEAVESVVSDYRPNQLTSYLYDQLAQSYSRFYEECPVLKADTPEQRTSRLLLCDLTARVLKQGLALLGIGTVERM
jgi:arginyl-tRNA synthetase